MVYNESYEFTTKASETLAGAFAALSVSLVETLEYIDQMYDMQYEAPIDSEDGCFDLVLSLLPVRRYPGRLAIVMGNDGEHTSGFT